MHNHNCTCRAHTHAARYDPTRTGIVRRAWEAEIKRRMARIAKAVREFVGEQDALDLSGLKTNAPFKYRTTSDRVNAFKGFLERQQKKGLLEIQQGPEWSGNRAWSDVYIESSYKKGIREAANQLKAAGAKVDDTWVQDGFLRPVHADSVGLVYTRTYTELEGVTAAMASQMSGALAQGMIDGKGPMDIAREMIKTVKGMGTSRARMIARSETIAAYAESSLNSYEEAGLTGVDVMAELLTAGDSSVCPECDKLAEGGPYTLDRARGMIPVHPNCRCAWKPIVDADLRGLVLR